MSIEHLVRPEVARLKPYEPAQQLGDTVRLNANEAYWTDDAIDSASSMNRYPEIWPNQIRAELANWYGVTSDNLLVTRGTSEAIDVLIRTFCRPGLDNIVVTPPTFEMYRLYADIQGAEVLRVPLDQNNDFSLDAEVLLARCTSNSKIVFVCSPNNPTGQVVPLATITRLMEDRKGKSIVVVDEAYIEFSDHDSLADVVEQYENLVVLRTTSKALAMAGARCGSAIARREIIDVLQRVLPAYSFATPVVQHVIAAMHPERIAFAEKNTADTIAAREALTLQLNQLPIVDRVWASQANFLLVRFVDADLVMQRTKERSVLLRQFNQAAGLDLCLRITIGSKTENEQLMDVLTGIQVDSNG